MPKFVHALGSWCSDSFASHLQNEIKCLEPGAIPLEKCTTQGGYVDDSNLAASVFHCTETKQAIQAKVGIHFTEIVICCGCGDEPMTQNAYCEMLITIDKMTAETTFILFPG